MAIVVEMAETRGAAAPGVSPMRLDVPAVRHGRAAS